MYFQGSSHSTNLAGESEMYYPKLSNNMIPPGMALLGDSVF